MDLDRARIFRLVETADNFVKYATPGHQRRAAERARGRYERALELAERRADAGLIEQIQLRLHDLEKRSTGPASAIGDGAMDPEDPATYAPDGASESTASAPAVPELLARSPDDGDRRVPPGQRVTRGWPVLHEGSIPRFDRQSWRLVVRGACENVYEVTYDQVKAFPNVDLRSDFHCVTGWSKLDNLWRGVQTKLLLQKAQPAPVASHVLVHGEQGYTANLPLDALLDDDTLITWSHNSQDLAPEHGFPLRLLVPGLYGWKSVKWVRAFELLTHDQRGFWETRGYHNHADPWREERYAYQEA